jgi:hypothetical protein
MAINFNSLVADVPAQLMARNTDLIGYMPKIIEQAERDMPPSVDHDLFRASASIALSAGTSEIDFTAGHPTTSARVLELRSIRLESAGSRWMLPMRNLEAMVAQFPSDASRGTPRHYAVTEADMIFALFPTPDVAVTAHVMMNALPAALTAEAPTGVYTTEADQLFEFRVFLRAAMYLKDQASIAIYREEVAEATKMLNAQIARRRRDETQVRPIETTNAGGR